MKIKNSEDLQQLCKIHKRNIEFTCANSQCKNFNQGGCSKCLLHNQQHYQCDVLNLEDSENDEERKQLVNKFELQFNNFIKKITTFFTNGKDAILKQVQLGNEAALENAYQLLQFFREMNSSKDQDDVNHKTLLIGDIWSQFQEIQEDFSQSQSNISSKTKSKQGEESCNESISNSKSGFSVLDQSSFSFQEDVSSISNATNDSSRKKVLLNNSKQKQPLQNLMEEISSQSSLNKSSSSSNYNQSINSSLSYTIPQRQSRIASKNQQISLGDFKWNNMQRFQIKSKYLDNVCLFETNYNGGLQLSNQIMQKEFDTDADSFSISKNYYLLTRSERQELQVFDLQKMRQLHRISFTNDKEIVHFKQISDKQVIIFSPNNKFLQVQNIFDEQEFFQIDFKFYIDSIACDIGQGLIFLGHQLGKLSVYCMKKREIIFENNKIHSKKITLMDFKDGRLITCCDSGSVKEFVFNLNYTELRQKQIFRKELISDDPIELFTTVKIINDETIMVQASEFIEVYQNGKKVNDETLEFLTSLSDMKIYDSRYGIMRANEEENIAIIFDYANLTIKKTIKLSNTEEAIIGAYYINNQLILLLENELIVKYSFTPIK